MNLGRKGKIMSDELLKPCPFCGRKPKLYRKFYQTPWYFHYRHVVECLDDNCLVKPKVVYDEECDAITAWNTRAEKTCHRVGSIEDGYSFNDFKCSECGAVLLRCCIDVEGEGVFSKPKFCPWCGAKVVEDEQTREV